MCTYEFPVKEINIDMPEWLEKLEPSHWLKKISST